MLKDHDHNFILFFHIHVVITDSLFGCYILLLLPFCLIEGIDCMEEDSEWLLIRFSAFKNKMEFLNYIKEHGYLTMPMLKQLCESVYFLFFVIML